MRRTTFTGIRPKINSVDNINSTTSQKKKNNTLEFLDYTQLLRRFGWVDCIAQFFPAVGYYSCIRA